MVCVYISKATNPRSADVHYDHINNIRIYIIYAYIATCIHT